MINIRKSILSYCEYYFYFTDTNLTAFDDEIAEKLNMTTLIFRNLMVDKFKARFQYMVIFPSREDAQNALDYINSLLVFRKIELLN